MFTFYNRLFKPIANTDEPRIVPFLGPSCSMVIYTKDDGSIKVLKAAYTETRVQTRKKKKGNTIVFDADGIPCYIEL